MSAELHAEKLTVRFGGVTAVRDLDLAILPGQILGLIGPNGAGKSTVINALTGYCTPETTGTVHYRRDGSDVDLSRMPTRHRARLGVVRTFQTPRLIPELSVVENVALGTVGADMRRRWFESFGGFALANGLRARTAAASETLDALGIGHLARNATTALSLGEQRLVEIARATVSGAVVALLDEPFAGLSAPEQERLSIEISALRSSGIAIMLVEHHLDHVRRLADTVVAMDQGAEFLRGAAVDVLDSESVRERYLGEVA